MLTRSYISGVFRGLAKGIYVNVAFTEGTIDQISQTPLKKGQLMFGLHADYKLSQDDPESNTELAQDFGVFVGLPDSYASGSEQSNNLRDTANVLVNQMIKKLRDWEQELGLSVDGTITTVPVYKYDRNSLTGVWATFNLRVGGCPVNKPPSMSNYFGEIGVNVNPLDWAGMEQNPNAIILQ